ncbi:MAG: hypothetical protein MUD03_16500 [Pirellula sp.]|jgi:ethanolamine ammonia-lyase large subunit|nr:hypothetical protein [Pirellula sp.]
MARQVLLYAPLITPLCGVLGAVVAIGSRYPLPDDSAIMLGFVTIGALILGVPAGMLFWAMSGEDLGTNRFWFGVMLAYCICIFALFYFPIDAIGSI